MAGARGHRRRLKDDGVAAGREPNCHLLIQDPPWSLEEEEGVDFFSNENTSCLWRINVKYHNLEQKSPETIYSEAILLEVFVINFTLMLV